MSSWHSSSPSSCYACVLPLPPNPCPPAHTYACDAHRSRVIITATGTKRGTKPVDLKPIVDQAISMCSKDGHKVRAPAVRLCHAVADSVMQSAWLF